MDNSQKERKVFLTQEGFDAFIGSAAWGLVREEVTNRLKHAQRKLNVATLNPKDFPSAEMFALEIAQLGMTVKNLESLLRLPTELLERSKSSRETTREQEESHVR